MIPSCITLTLNIKMKFNSEIKNMLIIEELKNLREKKHLFIDPQAKLHSCV